jgi:predicted nucleic acid-binding protein
VTKTGLIDLVVNLYSDVIITEGVYEEAVEQGKAGGHMDSFVLEQAIHDGKVKILKPSLGNREVLEMPILAKLGVGEKETVYEAFKEGCLAILDDRDSKVAASVLNVSFQSSPLILFEALLRGLLTRGAFEEALERLATVAGLPPDRVAELKRLAAILGR